MQLITHQVTSNGGRQFNEDALKEVTGQKFALLALADGLGGHGGGALAARQCVETIATGFSRAPGLSDAALQALVGEADRAIATLRLERRKPASSMRTTLAFLAVWGDDARWAHVGDSRIYWFRQNVLMQRTRDHSVSEFVLGLPDNTSVAPPDKADRHRLLRAMGAGERCHAELGDTIVTLQPDDAFLLCSDGLWSLVPDPEITACLSKATTPLDWCVALEQRLREHLTSDMYEEQDNYSMIAGMVMP
jgi:serine/threonine protein phosphatase PrpC